jgi:hypothetical protein
MNSIDVGVKLSGVELSINRAMTPPSPPAAKDRKHPRRLSPDGRLPRAERRGLSARRRLQLRLVGTALSVR